MDMRRIGQARLEIDRMQVHVPIAGDRAKAGCIPIRADVEHRASRLFNMKIEVDAVIALLVATEERLVLRDAIVPGEPREGVALHARPELLLIVWVRAQP